MDEMRFFVDQAGKMRNKTPLIRSTNTGLRCSGSSLPHSLSRYLPGTATSRLAKSQSLSPIKVLTNPPSRDAPVACGLPSSTLGVRSLSDRASERDSILSIQIIAVSHGKSSEVGICRGNVVSHWPSDNASGGDQPSL